jgi:hypothetical protein
VLTPKHLELAKVHKSMQVGRLIVAYLQLTSPNFGTSKNTTAHNLPQEIVQNIASYVF